jgi:hypothetical protein
MVVVETSLGLTLGSIPISLVASGINSSGQAACWSSGDVIVGCNGRIVQTKADLLRAMRFSDNQSVTLDVVSSQCVSSKENLPADWVRKDMAGKRIVLQKQSYKAYYLVAFSTAFETSVTVISLTCHLHKR